MWGGSLFLSLFLSLSLSLSLSPSLSPILMYTLKLIVHCHHFTGLSGLGCGQGAPCAWSAGPRGLH